MPVLEYTRDQSNGKASPFAGRRVRNYQRPHGRWYFHPALRDGRFTRWDAPAMMTDNAVSIGLYTMFGPLFGATHEVRSPSKTIKTFVEKTLYRFWNHDLMKVLQHYIPYGTAIGETMFEPDPDTGLWRYAGLDDFDISDVTALRRGRHLTGARVTYGSTAIPGVGYATTSRQVSGDDPNTIPNELRHPKLFWCAHRPMCGELYGKAALEPAFNPWLEKVGAHGAISIRKLWAFSNAYRGCLVKFPVGSTMYNGKVVDNQDIARELAETYTTGGAMVCPSGVDENGNPLWEIVDPKLNGEIKGLMEYPQDLDRQIWQGMGVLDEVIHAPDTGGSWSGRSGPLLIFLNICDMRVREITTAFDVGPSGYTTRNEQAGGVIRPLVMENFGPKAVGEYQIIPISLVPKPAEPGAGGSPGSAPAAATGMSPSPTSPNPVGPPPGPQGTAGVPTQPMGGNSLKLSAADPGGVELPDDAVAAILAGEAVALSAAHDVSNEKRDAKGRWTGSTEQLEEHLLDLTGYGANTDDLRKAYHILKKLTPDQAKALDDHWKKQNGEGASTVEWMMKDLKREVANGRHNDRPGRNVKLSAATFDETKIKRGQPENKGEFASKGEGGRAGDLANPAAAPADREAKAESAISKYVAAAGWARSVSAHVQQKITEAIDKAPGGEWLRGKMQQANQKIAARYGEGAAKKIVASGVALTWGAFIVGPLVGVPNYIPTAVAMVPGLVLAEAYYQLKGKTSDDKTVSLSAGAREMTDAQIEAIAKQWVKWLTKHWEEHQKGDVSLSAGWDESKHKRGQPDNAGQFGSGGGQAKQAPASQPAAQPPPAPAAAPEAPPKPKDLDASEEARKLGLLIPVSAHPILQEQITPPPPGGYNPDPTKDTTGDGVADAAIVGVPAMMVPPPPPIPKLNNLTEHERAVEQGFKQAFEANPTKLAGDFLKLTHHMTKPGDPPTFGTDDAKVLTDAWSVEDKNARSQNRATLNTPLHQTANAIAKRAFLMHMDTLKEGDELLVTCGGCGSGKGFALKMIPKAKEIKARCKGVWDSAGDQSATENPWIQAEAERRGLKVNYLYVHADPKVQWADPERGVIKRAGDPADGRMVGARVFADSYANGARNMQAFTQRHQNNPHASFTFLQNAGPKPIELPGIPPEALKIDAQELTQFAAEAVHKSNAPAHVKRGALMDLRIFGGQREQPTSQPARQ